MAIKKQSTKKQNAKQQNAKQQKGTKAKQKDTKQKATKVKKEVNVADRVATLYGRLSPQMAEFLGNKVATKQTLVHSAHAIVASLGLPRSSATKVINALTGSAHNSKALRQGNFTEFVAEAKSGASLYSEAKFYGLWYEHDAQTESPHKGTYKVPMFLRSDAATQWLAIAQSDDNVQTLLRGRKDVLDKAAKHAEEVLAA